MNGLRISAAILGRIGRDPAYLALVLAAALVGVALRFFLPLGLTTGSFHHLAAQYEVAFMLGGLAGLLSLRQLASFRVVGRASLGFVSHWMSDVSVMLVAASVPAAGLIWSAHDARTWQTIGFHTEQSLTAGGLGLVHLFAVVATVLRLQARGARSLQSAGLVAVLVIALTWVVPAVLSGDTTAERAVVALLDSGSLLRSSFDFPLLLAHWIDASLPILAWCAVGLWLAAPPVSRAPRFTSVHALRDPR